MTTVRRDQQVGVFRLKALERVPDRRHATACLGVIRPAISVGRPPVRARQLRAIDDSLALLVRHPAEAGAAMNPLRVLGQEAIHCALQESDPPAAGQHEPATDQPVAAPSADCLG